MIFLTDFGDLAILLPLAAAVLAWLVWARPLQAAGWWVIALLLCIGGIGLLKMYFFVCPTFAPAQNPSGHTGFAVLVYGAVTAFIALSVQGWARLASLLAGAALIAGIALSRVLLGAHSPLEIVLGSAIGLSALGLFLYGYLDIRPRPIPVRPLLLLAVTIIALLHGHELHAEEMLHALGLYLKTGAGPALCH